MHVCYEHDKYFADPQPGLHDIVLDDQCDVVWFKCPICKLWLEHDVCGDDFFWYDYRDTCHVVQCCACGVFVTNIMLSKHNDNVIQFNSIKEHAFLDDKLVEEFRNKLAVPADVPIDLFNFDLAKVDAYCNVNSPGKICNASIVECPASYNAHSLDGIDMSVSYVRRQDDKRFVCLASD